MALVSPSLLSADFGHLADDCEMLNNSEADYAHVDVMDGLFVPNISFGTPVIKAMKRHCNKPLDVHLMITDPGRYVTLFRDLGASILNVHYEACTHLHRTIQQIRDCGMKPAVTLNPATPVEVLRDILCDVDMVLLMSVNPGFGGQKFITRTLDKAQRLRTIIDEQGLKTLIEVDGGIDTTTAPLAVKAGIDVLVAGSFVFGSKNPIETIKWLKNL
ncbi:MAG: ribulose-phosphate 3-epimerase [Marinilabiliaceae bacterium]|nr:ribulose-phosphate 3-epimerase [Marinilabiliaceae bacterium]